MGDGKQSDACILCRLEDLAFHIDAHSAGTFIQEGVLRPWEWEPSGQGRLWTLQRPRPGLAPAPLPLVAQSLLELQTGPPNGTAFPLRRPQGACVLSHLFVSATGLESNQCSREPQHPG